MKRILLVLVAIVMCFTVVGCSTKTVEGNKEFGKYTGIYKLKNMELRIVHYKDTLSLILRISLSICTKGIPISLGTFITIPFTYFATASFICL